MPDPSAETYGPHIEVIQTKAVGWAWRCHWCDDNHLNLDETEARTQARTHQLEHRDV